MSTSETFFPQEPFWPECIAGIAATPRVVSEAVAAAFRHKEMLTVIRDENLFSDSGEWSKRKYKAEVEASAGPGCGFPNKVVN